MDEKYKTVARDCPVCKESKKIYIARMKRKEDSNKYYCDGCNNTMSDEQINEKWESQSQKSSIIASDGSKI